MANSIDAVSDRDYVLEYLAAGAILALHLSRLAEEIVLWCSAGFRFVTLSDAYTTGSSIMPQKRNPDAAELIRGKAGRVIGALNSLLVVMKGLPLSYGKDMQEDKEPLFDAADTLELCVTAMTGMIADMKANRAALKAATAHGFLTATDLADWLVRVLGMPFRRAHHVTGSIVKLAEERGCGLADLPLTAMQAVEPRITADIFSVLSIENAVASRLSDGGTAPERVRDALAGGVVRVLGRPSRRSHHGTGRVVKWAEGRGCGLADLPPTAMQAVEPRITADIFSVLSIENAVASRLSDGGTAPERVREAIAAAKERFL